MDLATHPLRDAGRARALGALLRELRGDLSQRAMASRIGMHLNYYGVMERGGIPSPGLTTLARLARGHGVSIALLARSYTSAEPVAIPARRSAPVTPSASPPISRGSTGAAVLGRALAHMREHARLTQLQLADTVDISRSRVAAIENGAKLNPGIATVASLVAGMTPVGTDLSLVVPALARVFAGEIELDAFIGAHQELPRIRTRPSTPPRGLLAAGSGEARRGRSAT